MTVVGQKAVSCVVPCTSLQIREEEDRVIFTLPEASLSVSKEAGAMKLVRRIREERAKRCGQFRIVLQFPAMNRRGHGGG